jgi:hypothetical protein
MTESSGESGDLVEVLGKLAFFDDEKAILVRFYKTKIVKSLHKKTNTGTRGSNHFGQFFVGNSEFDANAAGVFLTHSTRQLQQRLS